MKHRGHLERHRARRRAPEMVAFARALGRTTPGEVGSLGTRLLYAARRAALARGLSWTATADLIMAELAPAGSSPCR